MKKLFAILILVAFALGGMAQSMSYRSCWDGTVAETYDGGDGTQENPYQIATAEQLALLAQQTNDGMGGNAYYILTDDICLNGSYGLQWIPIGDQGYFTGVFDGNGHTISDMVVSDRSAGGLFARTNNATIKDVAVSNSTIQEVNHAGFIVGWSVNTSITNCSVDGVISYSGNASSTIGGVTGSVEVDCSTHIYIRNCVNNATIQANLMQGSSSEVYCVGGIVGQAYVDDYWSSGSLYIVDCCNNGDLYGRRVGGIVGSHNGYAYYCDNYGQINSLGASGGIVGNNYGVLKDCHNHASGAVTGKCAGGIVGYNLGGYISSCVNNAPACGHFKHTSPTSANMVGGILGYGENLWNCYNTGDVTFTLEENMDEDAIYVGGIGGNIAKCKNSYNVGAVASSDLQYAHCGIIAGCCYETKNVYWHGDYDLPVYGTGDAPEGSCAFRLGATPTSWVLDEPQYGTSDLVEALNAGANAIEGLYPGLGPVSRWDCDMAMINGGFPVFENMAGILVFNGSEWYYEILNDDGSVTYQHLEYAADTTIGTQRPKIIIRSNTQYDRDSIFTEVTREYVYEENGKVYWWNKDLEAFTMLYDLMSDVGDEWEIKVGTDSLTMHVDAVGNYEYDGKTYRMLRVSDENGIFSGDIVSGVGHLTSFFPERLMNQGKGYRVTGLRCYWVEGNLILKIDRDDCDAIYAQLHNGIEEDGPSTGSGTLVVYPNPANNVLFVQTVHAPSLPAETYRITNLMGQTVLSGNINAENQQINIEKLPAGMYFISVNEQTVKFVVK